MKSPKCSFCDTPLQHTFVDLGMAPMVSSYLRADQLRDMEPFFPLHAYVCAECYLVQLPEARQPEAIFSDYPYFSSVSESWLRHASDYVAETVDRFGISENSQVVEIASNDGYLLQYFKERGVPVLGIEPAGNVAKVAEEKGIPTRVAFFNRETAETLVAERVRADLLLGNNVFAHVPDVNDFAAAMKLLLKPGGVATLEFAYLLTTITGNQFDQVFHEHCSYLSLLVVESILAAHDLEVFDVTELPTHGGSIRVYAKHADGESKETPDTVRWLRQKERDFGLDRLETYASFSRQAQETKQNLLSFLIDAKQSGRSIVGYGAPGKGCIMLNYCGVRSDFLDYLVDLSPAKQGLYMPGVHIPIFHPGKIKETKPDYLLILPWNLKDEIMQQYAYIRDWGGRFAVPSPALKVFD